MGYESPTGEAGDMIHALGTHNGDLLMTLQNKSSYISPCASSDTLQRHTSCLYSNTFQMLYGFEESKLSLVNKETLVKYLASFVSKLNIRMEAVVNFNNMPCLSGVATQLVVEVLRSMQCLLYSELRLD